MRLKGKLVEWYHDTTPENIIKVSSINEIGQHGTIELEPGEIKEGDEVLIKMRVTSIYGGEFTGRDSGSDNPCLHLKDIVAVLPPQEPEKKEIEPIDPQSDSWEELCYRFNKLIKVVNEMRKK